MKPHVGNNFKLKSHMYASGSRHVEIHCFSHQSCQQEPRDPRDPNVCVMIGNVYIVPTNCSGPETDPLMQTFVSTRNNLFN